MPTFERLQVVAARPHPVRDGEGGREGVGGGGGGGGRARWWGIRAFVVMANWLPS